MAVMVFVKKRIRKGSLGELFFLDLRRLSSL